MKILVKKQFGKLIPVYNSDYEGLKKCKLKEGVVYECEIKKPRNPDHHKKMFALYNLYHDSQSDFETLDITRKYLTCKAGYYTEHVTPSGKVMIIADSISFSSMDQIEFDSLYEKTVNVICDLIDIDSETLMRELIEFM